MRRLLLNNASMISRPSMGLRSTLVAVASLVVFGASGAAPLDPEDVMIQEYQSFCLDYYTSTQCSNAIRFILRTSGKTYFSYLHNDQSMDGFLDRLESAVKGGETSLAKEPLAVKADD